MRKLPNILTPVTTKALVAAMLDAGYIEQEEHYPAVAELPTGFLYVVYNDNEDNFLVTEFVTASQHPDFNWKPHYESETFEDALAKFHAVFQKKLIA